MTIDEMKQLKQDTELAIRGLLLHFSEITGLQVSATKFTTKEVTPVGSTKRQFVITDCELEVKL